MAETAQWAVEFDVLKDGLMLQYDVLFEIVVLYATGVAMKTYAVFLNVKISQSFRHHSFPRHTTDIIPEFHRSLYYWPVGWAGVIINQSVLRQAHNFLTSEFTRKCDLVLQLSVSSSFYFASWYPLAAYAFFLLLFPSLRLFLPSCVQK